MDISRSMAQEIIDELGGILNQQLNFFDARGYILASAHPERVGSYHAGAARLIREGLDELTVYRDDEYEGARKGCNLPLVMDTAVVGAIGFVGLIVPHLLRPFFGHRPAPLLAASWLGGAALTLAADIAVRLLGGDTELRLGVATALIGAPFFFWLVLRSPRGGT